jgi:hypothetical protein
LNGDARSGVHEIAEAPGDSRRLHGGDQLLAAATD